MYLKRPCVPRDAPLAPTRAESARGQAFLQPEWDPCYFRKILTDGSRFDIVMYVDDGYVVHENSPLAQIDLDKLNKRFTITVKHASFLLRNSISVG